MSCVFHPSSSVETQQPSELNSIVGFKWLDLDKSVLLASPAIRILPQQQQQQQQKGGPVYHASYGVSQSKPAGPYHPITGKQACVGVTRRGVVRLTAQGKSDGKYYQVSSSLEGNQQEYFISHATWKGCKDGTLLLITYSIQSSLIRVYSVSIKWNLSAQKGSVSNATNNTTAPTPPVDSNNNELAVISVERILSTSITPPSQANGLALTHLEAIPNTPQQQNPSHNSVIENEFYIVYGSTTKSVVCKYSLVNKHITLHPSFYSLSNKRDNSKDELETKLTFHDAIEYLDSPIISLSFGSHDTFKYIFFSNGKLDLAYRGLYQNQSQQQQQDRQKPSTYIALYDAGYEFPPLAINNVCLSPNQASYAYLNEKDELKINYTERKQSNTITDEALLSSAIVLAVRHSISCFSNLASDDLFCVISKELANIKHNNPNIYNKFLRILLQESHRAVNFTLDLPKDYQIDKVMVNPSLQRLLSMQLTLGISKNWQRNPMSKVAWSVLNIRLLAFALTFTLRALSQPKIQVPAGTTAMELKSNHIQAMFGLIRWCTDLLAYICQELYMLSLDKQNPQEEEKVSISASIMFASVPRMLLIYSLRGIRGLETMTNTYATQENNPINGIAAATYQRLKETMSMAPVPLPLFEKMLTDVDGSIKKLHQGLQDRLSIEQKLMFDGKLPKELKSIKDRVVEVFRASLLPEINASKLYFYDVSWLGLEDEEDNKSDDKLSFWENEQSTNYDVDVLRKLIISNTAENKRKCVRCGGISVWDDLKTLMYTQWTVAFQKNCLCGGNWYSI